MKNHVMVEGRLLQTNKKFSQLKNSQKEKISNWLFESYAAACAAGGNSREIKERVISETAEKINDAGIWLPQAELIKYYQNKTYQYRKRYEKNKDRQGNC